MIQINNLNKSYGNKKILSDINLSIDRGGMTAILGVNGAGKSTMIDLILGFINSDSGQIIFDSKLKLGVVFQKSILDDQLTVKENLVLRGRQYQNYSKNYINNLVYQMGLNEIMKEKYGDLSGGQKRIIDILRGLINHPDVLFLDEPTTGLDIETRMKIWELLKSLMQNDELTVVLTTHYLEEVGNANNVVVLDQGKIIAKGSAKELTANNTDDYLIIHSSNCAFFVETFNGKLDENNVVKILVKNCYDVISILQENEKLINDFEYHKGTMNEAFVNLTGKQVQV